MTISIRVIALATIAVFLSTSIALARHRHRATAAPANNYVSVYDVSPGAIIAAATARAQREPGVVHEISPDARQTATGGPPGGLPTNGSGP